MNWKNQRELICLTSSAHAVQGIRLKKRRTCWSVEQYATLNTEENDPVSAWRKVLRSLGGGTETPLLLGENLVGGVFFQCRLPEMALSAMRGAVAFELPRHLFQLPPNVKFEFTCGEVEQGECLVNVYAFPAEALDGLTARLSEFRRGVDALVHPLLALKDGDKAVGIRGFEDGYIFQDGNWSPGGEMSPEARKYWMQRIRQVLVLPENNASGFVLEQYLGTLLIALGAVDGQLDRGDLNVLPKKLLPKRYRATLRVTACLLVCLAGYFLWKFGRAQYSLHQEITSVKQELQKFERGKIDLQSRIKKLSKEIKERQMQISFRSGERELLGKLAAFSEVLPENVMVNSLRWNENTVDFVLQSEAEFLDLATLLQPLTFWKIDQLQQRRMGNAAAFITLRVSDVSAGQEAKP